MSRRVLVTGGNKGIGLAICKAILKDHADTAVLLGSRDAGRGKAAVSSVISENPSAEGRIEMLLIDTSSDESCKAAAASVTKPLYAIVNNAGIVGETDEMLQVNTMGPIRVNEAFSSLLQPNGRICNISSGAGPGFVGKLPKDEQPTFTNPKPTMDETMALIKSYFGCKKYEEGIMGSYGLSKALLNIYTRAHALASPGLVINACSPGFIVTDLTVNHIANKMGKKPEDMGMKGVEESTVAPMRLLFGDGLKSGNYHGSDGLRSPLDYMRDPGAPEYDGP